MNFLKKIEKFNSNVCFIDENEKKYTYENILTKADLLSENLKERSLIFVLADNSTECLTAYIGFFKKGIVQMLLDPQISTNLLEELIETYKPNYILMPTSRIDDLKNYEVLKELGTFIILRLNKNSFYPINKDLALLLSTSGSTGSKKFVRISYENVYRNTKDIITYLDINKDHRTVTTMPPFYTYGLSVINTHLASGASIVVTKIKIIEKSFWKLINKQRVTSFAGVPYLYEILNKIKFEKLNLPHLEYFTQAGGALSKDLLKYFLNYSEKNKKKFIVMYGQTEATSRISYLPYNMLKKKLGSVGIPIPGGKISLTNYESNNVKDGEIIYEGKNVSMGYAKSFVDLNKGDENRGVLRTGDLGKSDKDGYIYITGRKSRDIKLFGHRVNLDEIEKILFKGGYNCLCYGLDNKVIIFHVDNKYNSKVLEYLSKITNINLDCFKLKKINKFPKNENGKVSYDKLEKFL